MLSHAQSCPLVTEALVGLLEASHAQSFHMCLVRAATPKNLSLPDTRPRPAGPQYPRRCRCRRHRRCRQCAEPDAVFGRAAGAGARPVAQPPQCRRPCPATQMKRGPPPNMPWPFGTGLISGGGRCSSCPPLGRGGGEVEAQGCLHKKKKICKK